MADPDFGTELSCVTDIAGDNRSVSGFRVVAEAIARRWITPRGRLIGFPDYGYDVTQHINDDMSPRDISALASALQAEAVKDQRVASCIVSIAIDNDGLMTIDAEVDTAQGPFSLTIAASAVSVELLGVT